MQENLQSNKKRFIQLAIESDVLRFGEFTLKSGRISPYFFNAGLFNTGRALAELGACYAQVIVDRALAFDVLFGPAYKGIPLAAAIAVVLSTEHGIDKPYAFNRKEAKDHGEGGRIVGADVHGKVLIVDDVITAGTAVREAISLISEADAELAGVAVGLDRQERGAGRLSAIQEVEQAYGVPVLSIVNMNHIIDYLDTAEDAPPDALASMKHYRDQYGV